MTKKIGDGTSAGALAGTEKFEVSKGDTTQYYSVISAISTYLAGISAWLPFTKLTGSASVAQLGASGYAATLMITISGVDFNSANTDNAIAITLPTGFTRYLVAAMRISGASASISTATMGLFTSTGGGGTALVAGGTAITITTASDGTNNNAQNVTVNNSATQAYTAAGFPTLYFRVGTAQGSAATGNVALQILPLP